VLDFLRSRGIGVIEIDGKPEPEVVYKNIVTSSGNDFMSFGKAKS
jgi:hypothetical protein